MIDKVSVLKELGVRVEAEQVDTTYQILESLPECKEFLNKRKENSLTKYD